MGYDCSDANGGDYQSYQRSGLLESIQCEKKVDLDLAKRDVREHTNPERTDVLGSSFGDIIAKVGITKLKAIFHVSCAMKMPGRKSATVRFEDCREGERERRFRYPTVNGHQDVTINWGGGGEWRGGWSSSRGPSPSIRLSGHRRVTRDKLDDGDSRTLLYEPTHVQF